MLKKINPCSKKYVSVKMHRLVLRVLFFASFTFYFLKAADVSNAAIQIMETQENIKINNVEPVINALCLDFKVLRSAVRAKLHEIFERQYPSGKLKLRAYEIENWPSGVDKINPKNWLKADLVRINERIPFYRFVPREKVPEAQYSDKELRQSLKGMKCLTSATLRDDYNLSTTRASILNRFKEESGKANAKKIDWRYLDRRQVPEKYNSVPLNGASTSQMLVYKNPEIIDNIHFYKFDYDESAEMLPRNCIIDGSSLGDYNSDQSVDKYEFDELKIDGNLLEFDNESEIEIPNRNSDKLCESANDNCVCLEDEDCLSECSMDSVSILESCLHAKRPAFLMEDICELRKTLKAELNNLFKAQHPDETFKLRDYEIRDWPEGISFTSNHWSRKEIRRIREKMHEFVFLKRPESLSISAELGIDKLGNLDNILDDSMTRDRTKMFLLTRYRKETGESSAIMINWHRLDRRDIPDKYKDIKINSITMNLKALFKNPEIVYNIHFFKASEVENIRRKRKIGSDEI